MVFVCRPSSRHTRFGVLLGSATAALLLAPTIASAHVELLNPDARYNADHQKYDPCGHPDNPPGKAVVATYQAGETITLRFDEYVQHTGHFRVALDPTGTDNFTSPTNFDDFYNSPEVLLDNISDGLDGGLHEIQVTLPDTPCNPCTLQLIQVMTDDGAWGPGNDDLYFQCADIVIEAASSEDGGDTTGDPPTDTDSDDGEPPPQTTTAPPATDSGDDDPGSEGGPGSDGTPPLPPGDSSGTPEGEGDGDGCACRSRADQPGTLGLVLLTLAGLSMRRRT